jgi:hypothetical protein
MKSLIVASVFLASLAAGWATAPAPAECRSCQQRTCSSDRSCGDYCTCVWPDGRDYKQGICVRMGDD